MATENYSSDAEIDQCILKGCIMKVAIEREGKKHKLKWKYVGGVDLKIGIWIEKIRILDG